MIESLLFYLHGILTDYLDLLQARKVAAAIEESQRLARLDEQAGGTMVTGVSFATMDSDEGEGLQYLNVILKVRARHLP